MAVTQHDSTVKHINYGNKIQLARETVSKVMRNIYIKQRQNIMVVCRQWAVLQCWLFASMSAVMTREAGIFGTVHVCLSAKKTKKNY